MNKIYLDYAATTPTDKEVLDAMMPYFSEKFGNPASIHSFGQEALEAVDKARAQIAEFLHCSPREIIFTSGATESNNMAIKGTLKASQNKDAHIITSSIEHHCVLNTCELLKKEGVDVTFLKVDKDGLVDPEDVRKAIKESTVLVSIMYANNEVGTIEPIAEIGKMIKEINV
ncbi:MAG: aminotransferase class V-fold PLP-dependent enzyme, partial [Candidatus Paceibacterota bacterium]